MHRGYLVGPQAKISSGCQIFARCGWRSCRCQRTLNANALRCLTACRQREKPRTHRSPKLITGRLWDAHLRERTTASRRRSRPAVVVAHHLKHAATFNRAKLTEQSPQCVDSSLWRFGFFPDHQARHLLSCRPRTCSIQALFRSQRRHQIDRSRAPSGKCARDCSDEAQKRSRC